MAKYRKKPVVIDAQQWNEGEPWVEGMVNCEGIPVIETLEGDLKVSPGDYIITGVKGERYPCKPDIFEATYETEEINASLDEFMDFGRAVGALKSGKKVARSGWNGKGMWIVLMPALYLDASVINARTSKHIGPGVDLDSQPYIVMWTAAQQWQPGWLASQADILATDWQIVE